MNKMKEIKDLTDSEIEKRIAEEKELLASLIFQKTSGQVQKPSQFNLSRKTIARMKTVLQERKLQKSK